MFWNSSQEFISRRKFRLRDISPFSANFAFVVYNCSDEIKVKFLQNEKELSLPFSFCGSQVYCSWEKLSSNFKKRFSMDLWNRMCFEDTFGDDGVVGDGNESFRTPFMWVATVGLTLSYVLLTVLVSWYWKKHYSKKIPKLGEFQLLHQENK